MDCEGIKMASSTETIEANKLKVTHVVMFKHGVAFYGLEGLVKDKDELKLTFKLGELDDVLKSINVIDESGAGYISAMSYDATEDEAKLFESISIQVPGNQSFTSALSQLKGAEIELQVGSQKVEGIIVGLEIRLERLGQNNVPSASLVLFNKLSGDIEKFAFNDIRGFKLLSEELRGELQFFLDAALAAKKKGSKTISLACEGEGSRKIALSYITESPIWKTSYRILLPKETKEPKEEAPNEAGTMLLSGWCLVENTTDQDWDHIQLSLVAGMPVTFKMPLFRPIYIQRPHVEPAKTTGAQVMDIADETGEVDYEEADMVKAKKSRPPPAPPMSAPCAAPARPGGAGGMGFARSMLMKEECAPMERKAISREVMKQQVAQQTQVESKDFGELFEYNISKPVSIKRQQSALVPIVNADVKGRKILVFNPAKNKNNPMACVEITNTSGLTLERGPVTLLYEDTLAGEAIMPFLNRDETRIISYAVEQGVVVNFEDESKTHLTHKVKFSSGYGYEYYYMERKREYKINNKTEGNKVLLLDHPRTAGYDLLNEEEHKETPESWRFEMKLAPKKGVKFTVKERQEFYNSFSLWDVTTDVLRDKITKYAKKKFLNSDIQGRLTEIATRNEELRKLQSEMSVLQNDLNRIINDQTRLRENLRVLQKSESEMRLREGYIVKFRLQENQFEETQAKIKEKQAKTEELRVSIQKMIDALVL